MPSQEMQARIDARRAELAATKEWYSQVRSQHELNGLQSWVNKLPKNIAKGTYLAALETINTVDSFLGETEKIPSISANSPTPGEKPEQGTAPEQPAEEKTPPLHRSFPEVFSTLQTFGEQMQEDNTTADAMTQALAQFGVPFAGWMRLLGGTLKSASALNLLRLGGAEVATAGTAFASDEGRVAELAEYGRQMENNFGKVLQKASPDGSLLNWYINWMTADRESEGEWEARWKNGVDSVVSTVAAAGLIKTAGMAFRAGKLALAEGGAAAGTPARQRGMVTFHTTPFRRRASEFIDDVFSMDRMGEGEGAAAFGYGLYFAENPRVGGSYKYTVGYASVRRHFRQALPDDADFEDVLAEVGTGTFTPEQDAVIKELAKNDWLGFDYPSQAISTAFSRQLKNFDPSPKLQKLVDEATVTLDVDISDAKINRFLRQDADYANQPDNVKEAINKAIDQFGSERVISRSGHPTGFFNAATGHTGRDFYDALVEVLGSKKKASEWLLENGVDGMQFFDAESRMFTGQGGFIKPLVDKARGKGKPTRNFILFDTEAIDRVTQEGQTVFEKGTK